MKLIKTLCTVGAIFLIYTAGGCEGSKKMKKSEVSAKAEKKKASIKKTVDTNALMTPQKELSDFVAPESVFRNGEFLYVSDLGKDPDPNATDGNGFISKISMSGDVLEGKFLPKEDDLLHSPKGMVKVDQTLYVADVNRVIGFNLDTKAMAAEYSFASFNENYLNDLVAISDRKIIVSGTSQNKLYEISLVTGKVSALDIKNIGSPNGMIYHAETKKLYINTMGEAFKGGYLYVYDTEKKIIEKLSDRPGIYDGFAMDGKKLLVTDWGIGKKGETKKGLLLSFDPQTGKFETLIKGLQGPADIYFDTKTRNVWIPQMKISKVSMFSLKADKMPEKKKGAR